jgi:diacylglycerol kinase
MDLDLKDKKGYIGFSYAWNGFMEVIKERNFRIHLVAALFVIVVGLYVELVLIEWALIILVIGIVLISEMFNSVIEQMIDYIKPEIHPTAKLIKDIAAGGVLVSSIIAVIIGLIIFLPKFAHIFM